MITDFIINVLCALPNLLLDSMQNFNLEIPANIFNGFNSILNLLGFMFPVAGLLPILVISFGIKYFQIMWALLIRIKSFIPTMGS